MMIEPTGCPGKRNSPTKLFAARLKTGQRSFTHTTQPRHLNARKQPRRSLQIGQLQQVANLLEARQHLVEGWVGVPREEQAALRLVVLLELLTKIRAGE